MRSVEWRKRCLSFVFLAPLVILGCQAADGYRDEFIAGPPPVLPEVALAAFSGDEQANPEHHTSGSPGAEVVTGAVTIRAALSHSRFTKSIPGRLILKIDLSAKATSPRKRKPLNLALVFDRSGSMSDENKFRHAMRAANIVFENLSDHDIVSLIAFNEQPTVLSPAGRAVNKDFLRFRLQQFGPTGDTNLSAALLEAFAQIDSKSVEGQMKRVIVLTDGLANRGITDPNKLSVLVAAAHERGIGVSTLGCGTDFSEEVLSNLAKAGGGRYTYVRSSERIPGAVAAELDGLLDVVAQNAKLEVRPTSGATITRVYGRFLAAPALSFPFELGDIRDGERGSFLIELSPSSFEAGSTAGADVSITLDNPETGTRSTSTIHAEASFSENPNEAKKSANQNVLVYANVLNTMEKAEEAIQSLDLERFKEAQGLFKRFYEVAHQHAIDTRDQQLLNQTFLLRHFMADLTAASERTPLHDHDDAKKQLRKGADYRRYLLEHHRPPSTP